MRFCSKCGRPVTPGDLPPEVIVPPAPPAPAQAPRPQEPPAAEPFGWYTPASARVNANIPGNVPAPPAFGQNPYSHPAARPDYHGGKKRRAWVIVLLSLLLVLVLVTAALFTYSYYEHHNGGVSGMGQGYSSPTALITDYFKAFQAGDEDTIAGMLPEPVLNYFHSQGYSNDTILSDIDYWYDGYGTAVTSWSISNQSPYQISNYNFSDYGIDPGDVTSFVDFSCTAAFDTYSGSYVVDFDLAQIGNAWYLIQVW